MGTAFLNKTVGEFVRENPLRARIFDKYGIDYCCGGKKTIAQASAQAGVQPEALEELLMAAPSPGSEDNAISAMGLTELARHIVLSHHDYLRREIPRIQHMFSRVINAHGKTAPEFRSASRIFDEFAAEIGHHMMKEERILFPAIERIDSSVTPPCFPFGTLANPIRMMEAEHDDAGNALEQIRVLLNGYSPPNWACNTVRALYAALEELEQDMHQHVHKENNVLFPNAIQKENDLGRADAQTA